MPDVSTLGLAVDSSGVRRATDDLGKFSSAGKGAAAAGTNLEQSMTKTSAAGTALGIGIAAAVVGVGKLASSFLELGLSAGTYQDLAEKTGASAAGLASMRTAADTAGISVASAADASVRLSVALSKIDDDGSNASRALEYLGINVKEFRALAPDEQFRSLGQALNQLPDGANKSAVAVALLGRAGADMLPFLKELGSETQRVTYLTDEQIKRADEFSDAAARNRSQIVQLAQAMATESLPAVSALTGAAKDLILEITGMGRGASDLARNNGVRDFSESAALGIAEVVDGARDAINTFAALGSSTLLLYETAKLGYSKLPKISGGPLDIFNVAENGPTTAEIEQSYREQSDATGRAIERMLGENRKSFRSLVEERLKQGKKLEELNSIFGGGQGGSGSGKGGRAPFKATADGVKKVKDEYGDLIARIREKTAAEQAELESGEKLTAAQRMQSDIFAQIDSGKRKLSLTQKLAIDAELQELLAVEKLNMAREAEVKWMNEAAAANASYIEQQMASRDQLAGKRRDAELDLAEYGKTEAELKQLEIARLRDAAASLEQKAAQADNAYLEENARLYREQADELTRTADARQRLLGRQTRDRNDPTAGAERAVKEYLADIERAGDATARVVSDALYGLEDVTLAVLTGKGGADAAKQWVDQILAEVMRLYVVKPLLKSIFGGKEGGGTDWGSIIGSVAGFFGGSGGTYSGGSGGSGWGSSGGISGGGGGITSKMSGEPELAGMGIQSAGASSKGSGAVNIQLINNGEPSKAKGSMLDDGTIQIVLEKMEDRVAGSIASGGKVATAMASTFQLNRAGSAPRY